MSSLGVGRHHIVVDDGRSSSREHGSLPVGEVHVAGEGNHAQETVVGVRRRCSTLSEVLAVLVCPHDGAIVG